MGIVVSWQILEELVSVFHVCFRSVMCYFSHTEIYSISFPFLKIFTVKAYLILLYVLSVSIKMMMMWSVFMSINMMDQPYRLVELTLHCWDETTWAMAYNVLILIFDSVYILLKIFYLCSPERFICSLRYDFIQFLHQLQCFYKMSLVVCFFPTHFFFVEQFEKCWCEFFLDTMVDFNSKSIYPCICHSEIGWSFTSMCLFIRACSGCLNFWTQLL